MAMTVWLTKLANKRIQGAYKPADKHHVWGHHKVSYFEERRDI